jgi:hypothetical protein
MAKVTSGHESVISSIATEMPCGTIGPPALCHLNPILTAELPFAVAGNE